jgi:YbbR domain-containing protein
MRKIITLFFAIFIYTIAFSQTGNIKGTIKTDVANANGEYEVKNIDPAI